MSIVKKKFQGFGN